MTNQLDKDAKYYALVELCFGDTFEVDEFIEFLARQVYASAGRGGEEAYRGSIHVLASLLTDELISAHLREWPKGGGHRRSEARVTELSRDAGHAWLHDRTRRLDSFDTEQVWLAATAKGCEVVRDWATERGQSNPAWDK
jgi:hypothetical protein